MLGLPKSTDQEKVKCSQKTWKEKLKEYYWYLWLEDTVVSFCYNSMPLISIKIIFDIVQEKDF